MQLSPEKKMTETLHYALASCTMCNDAVSRHFIWGDTPSPKKTINSFLKSSDVTVFQFVLVFFLAQPIL
jgi:hypothetical protein